MPDAQRLENPCFICSTFCFRWEDTWFLYFASGSGIPYPVCVRLFHSYQYLLCVRLYVEEKAHRAMSPTSDLTGSPHPCPHPLFLFIYLAVAGLSWGMWGLVPWVGIETGPRISGMWSLSHWTTREVPPHLLLYWIKHLPVSVWPHFPVNINWILWFSPPLRFGCFSLLPLVQKLKPWSSSGYWWFVTIHLYFGI